MKENKSSVAGDLDKKKWGPESDQIFKDEHYLTHFLDSPKGTFRTRTGLSFSSLSPSLEMCFSMIRRTDTNSKQYKQTLNTQTGKYK